MLLTQLGVIIERDDFRHDIMGTRLNIRHPMLNAIPTEHCPHDKRRNNYLTDDIRDVA